MIRKRLIVGVLTCANPTMADRRDRLRQSWMGDLRRCADVEAYFLFGGGPIGQDDELHLNCPDDYNSLPQKTREFCRWAVANRDFDYLFKCDDDTLVIPERLLAFPLAGKDYAGANMGAYCSGGAGYFLSRRAAQIVAEHMTQPVGAEDLLVGDTLRRAGIGPYFSPLFVPYSNDGNLPHADNDTITGHAMSGESFWRGYRAAAGRAARTTCSNGYRIVMPTSNNYVGACAASLQLLGKYWPDHPPVDVVHFEKPVVSLNGARQVCIGNQAEKPWPMALRDYLAEWNHDDILLLMLDDYAVSAPVDKARIELAASALLADPSMACVHLTWNTCDFGKKPYLKDARLCLMPEYPYTVNLQAAFWRRSVLLALLQEHPVCTAADLELRGSNWFDREMRPRGWQIAGLDIPRPENASGFVDETDKTGWAIQYNNLYRRGAFDARHADFLKREGLTLEGVAL